jgi:hypothetical protein
MGAQSKRRKPKVSNRETIGKIAPKRVWVAQKHAYSPPSNASGKDARALLTSIWSSAS